MIKIGIVAPSSVIPSVEFELGAQFLMEKGYEIEVHPSVFGEYYFYPAPDEIRAQALIEFACRDDLDAIWAARGGYGATHLLPYLDRAKKKLLTKKKKVLLGYSDSTALHEWFRVNLGWKTIHAPMPSLRTFSLLKPTEWNTLQNLLGHTCSKEKVIPYEHGLTPVNLPKGFKGTEAPLVGGNLFVWNSLLGTPSQGNAKGKILFLEEIQENLGRINRMVHHLEQANGFKGTKAIVLGDFLDCYDSVPNCLKEAPGPNTPYQDFLRDPPASSMRPLRTVHHAGEGLDFVFRSLGERLNVAIFKGLPVGHGPNFHSLFLGKKHRLQKNGKFTLTA